MLSWRQKEERIGEEGRRGDEKREGEKEGEEWGGEIFFQKIFENNKKEIRMVGDMFEIQGYGIQY